MKKTPKQLLQEIKTFPHNKGRDSWYTAICPICGISEEADDRGSSSMAELGAKSKVMMHIKRSHSEDIDDTTPAA